MSIRNQTFHIRNGNGDTIKLLDEFGIQFPITDFYDAARKFTDAYVDCITNLLDILKKKYHKK